MFVVEKIESYGNGEKLSTTQAVFFTRKNAKHFVQQLRNEDHLKSWRRVYRLRKSVPAPNLLISSLIKGMNLLRKPIHIFNIVV